ncbi:MAG: UdgX family uracil-DNA binding protein, partial [Rhodoblastus sp.]
APTQARRTATYQPADSAASGAAAQADDLAQLSASIKTCTACDLCRFATQAVPGEGPRGATLMFVGEQPGDEEDIQGRPFVGPAGKVFAAALERLEIEREKVFVTNAVKHFKFEPRGKKRIHKKPGAREIAACNPWLHRELELVKPRLVVALGATAATALLGRATPLRDVRNQTLEAPGGAPMRATVHPSYLLRLPDRDAKKAEWRLFLEDIDEARRISGF